jgi:DNA replication protein DnaC
MADQQPQSDTTTACEPADSETVEVELAGMIRQKRIDAGLPPEPKPIAKAIAKQVPAVMTATELEARQKQEAQEREAAQRQWQEQQAAERRRRWDRFIEERGGRYENCCLENFVAKRPDQRKAITQVRAFAAKLAENIDAGKNVLFIGTVGTGKDHLMTALIRLGIEAGKQVLWRSGADLYRQWRDEIKTKVEERDSDRPLEDADVLAISDPLPGRNALTDWQGSRLASIIDRRYSRRKPTWLTINVTDRKQFGDLTDVGMVDRLLEGDEKLVVKCLWPSWRETTTADK